MKHYYPDFDNFLSLCEQGDTIPVYRQLLSDSLTPVAAYHRLANPTGFAASQHCFLLESVVGGEQISRYSFVGADPELTFTARRDQVTIAERGRKGETSQCSDPLAALQELLAGYHPVSVPNLPGFTGGVLGYAGYDTVRYYEDIGDGPEDDRGLPDMCFGLYRTLVLFDHVSKTVKVVCNAHVDGDPGEAYEQAVDSVEKTIRRLMDGQSHDIGEIRLEGLPKTPYRSNFARKDFLAAVEKCREYITAGDIFQVVISQRLTVASKADPFDIYRALRVVNPSPFMFLLKSPDCTLVGSSPEILCRVEDGIMTSRPLAGTRPRGADSQEDKRLEAELLADAKECSEHVMLVDLARNDLGIVAQPGTITLDDLMTVERYSHVMHIVSNVKGKLAEGLSSFDALRATLPVGTVSGAPKIRAMEIIDELEPTRRGPYAGAVGYVDFGGNMDTCIALRTMVISGNEVHVQAGAGIVADSVPENEYQETLNKAGALLRAINIAEAGFSN